MIIQVTSSPLSLKRNPSSVSASSQGPGSPLRRAVSSVSERTASALSEASQRRMVAASPCSCDMQQSLQSLQQPGHENYDIPRHLGRQVSAASLFQAASEFYQKFYQRAQYLRLRLLTYSISLVRNLFDFLLSTDTFIQMCSLFSPPLIPSHSHPSYFMQF